MKIFLLLAASLLLSFNTHAQFYIDPWSAIKGMEEAQKRQRESSEYYERMQDQRVTREREEYLFQRQVEQDRQRMSQQRLENQLKRAQTVDRMESSPHFIRSRLIGTNSSGGSISCNYEVDDPTKNWTVDGKTLTKFSANANSNGSCQRVVWLNTLLNEIVFLN